MFGHVARLDPRVPAHDALRLMVDTTKGERPDGEDRRVACATSGDWINKIQEDDNALLLSTLWRSEIAMGYEAAQRSLGLRDDDDGNVDDEG